MSELIAQLVYPDPLGPSKIKILVAPDHIFVADKFLEGELHPDVHVGDGILTIEAVDGSVSYGLGPHHPFLKVRLGRKSGTAESEYHG